MNVDDFRNRLIYWRVQKNVSARKMSIELDQAPSYINKIENKKSMPSLEAFFSICNYLNLTPAEFFNDKSYSAEMIELIKDLENISPELLAHIHVIVRNLRKEPFEDL